MSTKANQEVASIGLATIQRPSKPNTSIELSSSNSTSTLQKPNTNNERIDY